MPASASRFQRAEMAFAKSELKSKLTAKAMPGLASCQARAIMPGHRQCPDYTRRFANDRHRQEVFGAPLLAALDQNLPSRTDLRPQPLSQRRLARLAQPL